MVGPSIPVGEGDLIAGKYRVERVLGAGGMGVVVAARHEALDQLVAIKFVREDVLGNDEAIERFMREARAVVRLKSEHVARVLDVGKLPSGTPYMVMEFLDGMDAQQALAAGGPMPSALAANLLLQVCEAVSEAHAAGIVHRDLKPQNLFLTRTAGGSPRIKVLDFGVSKAASLGAEGALTRTSAMLGSPLYMAPEQMRSSRDVDARVDVWALGVVLFELLTARNPFEADSLPQLCLRVAMEPPLPLAALRPDVPPGMVQVVTRCLEKDPNDRFANAAELALALEPFATLPARAFAESAQAALWIRGPSVLPGGPGPAPPRTTSSPPGWDIGGKPLSNQPRRSANRVVWALFSTLLVAALAVLLFVARGAKQQPSSSSPASLQGAPREAPAVQESSAAGMAPALLAPPVAPITSESAAGATNGTPGGNVASPAKKETEAPAWVVTPPTRPGAALPAATSRLVARKDAGAPVADDDIPALR